MEVPYTPTDTFKHGISTAQKFMKLEGPEEYYIVGGFCRDSVLGRPYRDIDIFIPGSEPVPEGAEELEYDLSHNFTHIWDGVELNIIYMQGAHTLQSLIARCDVGICQVGTCAKGETITGTPAFMSDLQNQTLTVTRTTRLNHLNRVVGMFPGWRLVDPYTGQHTGGPEAAVTDLF